jgi:hypothetical protein
VGCEDFDICQVLDYGYFTISWIDTPIPYMHNLTSKPIRVEVWYINADYTEWFIKDTIQLDVGETKKSRKYLKLEDIAYALTVNGQYTVIKGTEGR